jgi:hypothetical protein
VKVTDYVTVAERPLDPVIVVSGLITTALLLATSPGHVP